MGIYVMSVVTFRTIARVVGAKQQPDLAMHFRLAYFGDGKHFNSRTSQSPLIITYPICPCPIRMLPLSATCPSWRA